MWESSQYITMSISPLTKTVMPPNALQTNSIFAASCCDSIVKLNGSFSPDIFFCFLNGIALSVLSFIEETSSSREGTNLLANVASYNLSNSAKFGVKIRLPFSKPTCRMVSRWRFTIQRPSASITTGTLCFEQSFTTSDATVMTVGSLPRPGPITSECTLGSACSTYSYMYI